jgi:G3E family GTPase
MKTKIDVFSGFLGAGKTMLIKKLINEKLYNENIVIIENELGQVGIDGSILKRSNIEVKEINSGCICCTILGDFKKAIEEIIEKYKPQRIIIEPSGVGKLSDVLRAINDSKLKNELTVNIVITVIDVLKFEMYITNFSEFYKNQIINANTIILSRTQDATSEKLKKVVRLARELNENANIITTPWDHLKGETIIGVSEKDTKQNLMEKVNLFKKPIGKVAAGTQWNNNINNHFADEVFNSWGIETTNIFSEKALKDILDNLNNSETYGLVLRAKGIVQAGNNDWIQFDYVPEEFQIRRITPDYTGRVCVIGSNLKKHNLKNLFRV